MKQVYSERSQTVHRTSKQQKGKAPTEFIFIRDIIRRAISSALFILGGKWEADLDSLLTDLPISREAQDLAEAAAIQVGTLTRCH
jgi:hypothetical protein